jgi:hypothetical protein
MDYLAEYVRVVGLLSAYAQEIEPPRLMHSYSMLRILKAVAKLTLLNAFEARVLIILLKRNKWKRIDSEIVRKYSPRMVDLLKANDCEDVAEHLRIQLFALLCAYNIKITLCDPASSQAVKARISKYCKCFGGIFKKWMVSECCHEDFNLRELNLLAFTWHSNYNQIVEEILNIAPPYNTHKPDPPAPPTFKKPVREPIPKKEERQSSVLEANLSKSAISVSRRSDKASEYQDESFDLDPPSPSRQPPEPASSPSPDDSKEVSEYFMKDEGEH